MWQEQRKKVTRNEGNGEGKERMTQRTEGRQPEGRTG